MLRITTVQPKIFAGQNFAHPTYPYIAEMFHTINFHPRGEDCHRFYVLINMGQKFIK